MGLTVEVTSYQDAFAHFDKEAFLLKIMKLMQLQMKT